MTRQAEDGLPSGQRRWAVLTISISVLLAVIDASIANVALPTIARDLRTDSSSAVWVVNAYQLATVVALLPLASLGEIIGYGRVYRAGLSIFIVASVFCAVSHTLTELAVARAIQGVGAAGIVGINGALIRFIYPAARLGRGAALIGMMVAAGAASGPTLAGVILSVATWPALFLFNIPVGLFALALAWRSLPHTFPTGRPFDGASALLNAATFGLLITGIDALARFHIGPGVLATAAGLVAGTVLVRRQLGRLSPLLPIDLLAIAPFRLAILTSVASFVAQACALVAIPFLLQRQLGRSPVETGLLMTPWPLASFVAAPLVGRLADRYPVWLLSTLGLLVNATGLALMSRLPAAPTDMDIGWRMAVAGLGFVAFQAPNNRMIIRSAPRDRAGGASGMLSMARVVGQTTGALAVAIAFARLGGAGPHVAITSAACVAVAAAGISLLRSGQKAPDTAGAAR